MISHPKCVLSKDVLEIPDCIPAVTKTVEKTDVSETLRQYRSVCHFRHLKRVRPEKTSGKLEILVGKNIDEFENSEMFREIKVPARAPLSRWEWKISNAVWPINLPNVTENTNLMERKYFNQSELESRLGIFERLKNIADENYFENHGPRQAAILGRHVKDRIENLVLFRLDSYSGCYKEWKFIANIIYSCSLYHIYELLFQRNYFEEKWNRGKIPDFFFHSVISYLMRISGSVGLLNSNCGFTIPYTHF